MGIVTTAARRGPLVCALATTLSLSLSNTALAAEDDEPTQDNSGFVEEVVVTGNLRALPGENVESIFGFQKSLLETPRSASTISFEQIERFNINDIDELVALAPGTFTQSFFGVAGSLDVRGTPGETYFRGIRRLDNPGNYPTPIAAADRIDIVRGPASPIFGPAKVGGYLNFQPKSARADSGQYLSAPEGEVSYTRGRWNQNVVTAEVGGPASIGGKDFGYYLFGEIEDSGSFYDNSETEQTILQASFDMDVTDQLRIQFGGMYHDYQGNQIAGWNRLTQDLIDNGTYITGSPQPLDTNGDGSISHQEYRETNIIPFIFGLDPETGGNIFGDDQVTLDELGLSTEQLEQLALVDPGTAKLSRSNVLVAPDDTLENEALLFYFDVVYTFGNGLEIKNQLYYEEYQNLNENAYGFSQFHDSWVVEDKLVLSGVIESNALKTSWQLSPSLRYTDFDHGDDFENEYFDRRDLTGPSTALDRRLLATRINRDYTTYSRGDYLNLGFAGLLDLDFNFGLNITLGARYDTIDIESEIPNELLLDPRDPTTDPLSADDTVSGTSWTASISYDTPWGIRPYFTASEQSTIIAGQGAEIDVDTILAEGAFDQSELLEFGVKGSFLDDKLYMALAIYEQERTDFSAQAIVTNQTTKTEGTEFELRWAVTDQFTVTGGWSNVEVVNLQTLRDGSRFQFIGNEDVPGIAGEDIYGGYLIGILFRDGEDGARRAGMPENIYSLTGTYSFANGLSVFGSVIDAEAVNSSFSGSVELPAYTLLNLGLAYERDNWFFNFNVKNVTDEEYFRANFPNLFGSQIVLPELPRSYVATVRYAF
ncbi:MAG: TonB-dependent receptor plug domain-containing protein [Pseudomonadota bacterium]